MADANAPDLYVPLMSFITFVLVTGYARGSAALKDETGKFGKFSPEVSTTTPLGQRLAFGNKEGGGSGRGFRG